MSDYNNEKLDEEAMNLIRESALSDSTKIIRYLEEQKANQRINNIVMTTITILGAIGSVIAAVISLLLFIQ